MRTNPRSNVVNNMIKAGCFDEFGPRKSFLENDYYVDLIHLIKHSNDRGWTIPGYLLSNQKDEMIPISPTFDYTTEELMNMEYSVTNLYLSNNPVNLYKAEIDEYISKNSHVEFGFITDYKQFKNKNGYSISIDSSDKRFMIFKGAYEKNKENIDFTKKELVYIKYKDFKPDQGLFSITEIGPAQNILNIPSVRRDIYLNSDNALLFDVLQKIHDRYHDLNFDMPKKYKMYINLKDSKSSTFIGYSDIP